jgi:predicted O-methyltransferase YrrM
LKTGLRARLRLKRFEIEQAFGLVRRGWFIPYRYIKNSPSPNTPYPSEIFQASRLDIEETLRTAAYYKEAWPNFLGNNEPPIPRFNQDWFPGLDAAVLYGLVRARRPNLIIEVGSGHSTRFAAQALLDGKTEGKIIAIDPAPRADISKISDRVEVRLETVQSTPLTLFQHLKAGDILFIDSSHILMPGSDVDVLMNRVLPFLPNGILIHIHDIFLPSPYPSNWEWRGYNEQNAVAALLTCGQYQILAANQFARSQMSETVTAIFSDLPPVPSGALETSLWLKKRDD